MFSRWLLFIVLLLIHSIGYAKTPLGDLETLFKAATENTAQVRSAELAVQIAKQQKKQAWGEVLPNLAVESNNVWRDQADVGPFGEGFQASSQVTLNQPLFRGGSEYYNLKIAANLPKVAEFEKQQQKRALFQMVAAQYFRWENSKQLIALLLDQEKTLRDRVSVFKNRVKIGRSKATDLLAAQSQLARVRALKSQATRDQIASENMLKSMTGLEDLQGLFQPINVQSLQFNPSWNRRWTEVPQIKAAVLLKQNAEREIQSARGSYLPSVDANANYYLQRAGILRDSQWDVTVNARWELYDGGADTAQVSINQLRLQQLEAQLTDLKRENKNRFASLRDQFFANQTMLSEFDQSTRLAESNYKQHLKEANQGLVSDLDALRVLQDYLEIRQTAQQQRLEMQLAWAELYSMVGSLP